MTEVRVDRQTLPTSLDSLTSRSQSARQCARLDTLECSLPSSLGQSSFHPVGKQVLEDVDLLWRGTDLSSSPKYCGAWVSLCK